MERQGQLRSRAQGMIHKAVEQDDLGQVKFLLKHASPNMINHRAQDGLTPLLRTCKHGFTQMARILLENGAQIDDTDSEGNTCLHYAAREKHHELVQVLLKSCARTFIRNNEGMLPVDMAVEATAEIISNKMMKDGPTEFVAACQRMKSSGKLYNKCLVVLKDSEIIPNHTRRVSLPAYFPE